jgi:hypothetical protein
MEQFIIMIDLGYLKATSADILKCKPRELELQIDKLCELLIKKAIENADSRLLRIYFYDGAIPNTPLIKEHGNIAKSKNVYLRLGQLRKNEDGTFRQK